MAFGAQGLLVLVGVLAAEEQRNDVIDFDGRGNAPVAATLTAQRLTAKDACPIALKLSTAYALDHGQKKSSRVMAQTSVWQAVFSMKRAQMSP